MLNNLIVDHYQEGFKTNIESSKSSGKLPGGRLNIQGDVFFSNNNHFVKCDRDETVFMTVFWNCCMAPCFIQTTSSVIKLAHKDCYCNVRWTSH